LGTRIQIADKVRKPLLRHSRNFCSVILGLVPRIYDVQGINRLQILGTRPRMTAERGIKLIGSIESPFTSM